MKRRKKGFLLWWQDLLVGSVLISSNFICINQFNNSPQSEDLHRLGWQRKERERDLKMNSSSLLSKNSALQRRCLPSRPRVVAENQNRFMIARATGLSQRCAKSTFIFERGTRMDGFFGLYFMPNIRSDDIRCNIVCISMVSPLLPS